MDSTATVTPNTIEEPTELVIKSDWLAAKLIENGYQVLRMERDRFRKDHYVHIFPYTKEISQMKDGFILEREDEKDKARTERRNKYSSYKDDRRSNRVTAEDMMNAITKLAEQLKNKNDD